MHWWEGLVSKAFHGLVSTEACDKYKRFLCRLPSKLSLCPVGKFEEREDRVPKLEQLNSLGFMCSLNLVLNKRDLIKMELLLLETFSWNLCMPTPAHFIDYYLQASVQEGDLYNGWPLSSLSKTKTFMDKYTHYFLEVSLQGEG
jgi:hypothetical protein